SRRGRRDRRYHLLIRILSGGAAYPCRLSGYLDRWIHKTLAMPREENRPFALPSWACRRTDFRARECMATILLIEDAPDIRQVVELILHSAGHTVLSAPDGASGVAMAEQHQPDLVVMDLALPQLDGWEATRRLKANPLTQPIPVLACTA